MSQRGYSGGWTLRDYIAKLWAEGRADIRYPEIQGLIKVYGLEKIDALINDVASCVIVPAKREPGEDG